MAEEKSAEAGADDEGAVPEAGLFGRMIDRCGIVFAVGLIVSALVLMQEVILRYLFNAPTIWAHETTIFLSGLAFVYGGLYCVSKDKHIRVVLIYDALSPRARRVLDVVISLISAAASALFAWAAWIMVGRAVFAPTGGIRFERSGSAWDPMFPALIKLFMFAIMILMAVQFLILARNYFKGRK